MVFFYKNKKDNTIFTSFLRLLNVKHSTFSNQYYNEHPNKSSLLGLSQLLFNYNIDNKAFKIEVDKKEILFSISCPFIACIKNGFIIISKITPEKICYLLENKKTTSSFNEFLKIWTGIILIAEPNEQSEEPNYKENKKLERFLSVQKKLLYFSIFTLFSLLYISNQLYQQVGISILLFLNIIGINIAHLLLTKQMDIQNQFADKICTFFKQNSCDDILKSKGAKFIGLINWSEIGLGYFGSNTIVLLLLPHLISYSALINLFVLPYSLWSIWYQKVIVKQWCPLCLIVQAIVWIICGINILFHYTQVPELTIYNILTIGFIYLLPVLLITYLIPIIINGKKVEEISYEMNCLKTNREMFLYLLKKQPYYQIDKSTSHVLFGNPKSKIRLTILTDPHCEPCSRLHNRITNLLNTPNNKLEIQYIFHSFNKSMESSSRFLINTYFTNDLKTTWNIYDEWFKKGKLQKEDYFKKYSYKINDDKEFQSHKEWAEKQRFRATPTVLVNGYKLPNNYKIEDLGFLSDLDIDTK